MAERPNAPRIPSGWMRDVYGSEHTRQLLDVLGTNGPMRYSKARRATGLRPAEFQRAIEKLERHGLLQIRAPANVDEPPAQRRTVVILELSGLGQMAYDLAKRLDSDFREVLRDVPVRLTKRQPQDQGG